MGRKLFQGGQSAVEVMSKGVDGGWSGTWYANGWEGVQYPHEVAVRCRNPSTTRDRLLKTRY